MENNEVEKDIMENNILKNLRNDVEFSDDNKRLLAVARFNSLDDAIDTINDLPSKFKRVKDVNDEWTYGEIPKQPTRKSYADELLKNGDCLDEVADYVEKYKEKLDIELSDLNTTFKSCVRRRRFSDDGAELNIDRALSGEPEFWETHKRDGKKRFITLAVQICMSHQNKKESFAKNMALAYSVCEILENLGYGVNIDILSSAHNMASRSWMKKRYKLKSNTTYTDAESGFIARVKDSADRTDLRSLASASIPSVLREYSFVIFRSLFSGTYGNCMETTQEYLDFCEVDLLIAKQWNKEAEQLEQIVQSIRGLIEND